jgi:hypothetical protein
MSQMSGEGGQDINSGMDQGQGQVDNTSDQGTVTPNINPAWSDVLGLIPETMHSQITPHFQKWDQNYQQSVQKVHSQYEPWKPFIDGGVDPANVDFSLGLMNAISTNPQEVMTALQEWIDSDGEEGFDQGDQSGQQGQFDQTQQNQGQSEFDITQHPKFQEMEEALQTMAQLMLGEREKEQSAQQDQELEDAFASLKQEHGEFDEKYVLGVVMSSGQEDFDMSDLQAAVKQYQELEQNILSGKRQPGPPVLGSGGAFPNSTPDARKLGSKDTKNLVAQMLSQAKQSNG